jgi:predicted Zn-dependent peptidase
MEDLDAATIEDVRGFFRTYYAPNNAVLTVVGDFDETEARALVEKYFSSIPNQPAPPPVDVREPEEVAQNTEIYIDSLAPAPAFVLGWKIPVRRTPDFYALSLAGNLLFEGDSSRLYQQLVKGDESVVSIQGGIDERRGPSALYVFALPKPGQDVKKIRQQIFEELKRLATGGPSEDEMEKLRNSLSNDAVRGRQSTMYRAQRIAEFALYDNDPGLVDSELNEYLAIGAEQIRDAVRSFLDVENHVTLDIVPAALAEATEATAPASPQSPGEPRQPFAPAPQVPPAPPPEPGSLHDQEVPAVEPEPPHPERPQDPAQPQTPKDVGSGPLSL